MQALDLIEILPELFLLLVICFILLITPFMKESSVKDEDVFFTPKAAKFCLPK
jgi:NADH-quinone oxidoreductase subunit N